MKKFAALFICLFSLFIPLFAEEDLFSFSAGIQSGLVFYGSDTIKEVNDSLNGSHALIGGQAAINLNAVNEATFFAGADVLCDFIKEDSYHSNHFTLDFPFGIKIYPDIFGLGFGVAYVFGYRYDVTLTSDVNDKTTSSWGNGFKFFVEYNFAHQGKSKYLPSAGIYWKFMPRGSNYVDNIIAAYINCNF